MTYINHHNNIIILPPALIGEISCILQYSFVPFWWDDSVEPMAIFWAWQIKLPAILCSIKLISSESMEVHAANAYWHVWCMSCCHTKYYGKHAVLLCHIATAHKWSCPIGLSDIIIAISIVGLIIMHFLIHNNYNRLCVTVMDYRLVGITDKPLATILLHIGYTTLLPISYTVS